MNRRIFLQKTALASAALWIPNFLYGFDTAQPLASSRSGKILVVVQFSGGNDGLNTIVPFRNDLYYKKRPSLGIAPDKVLKIGAELGFNPALAALQPIFDDGAMTVINSVGYPNPDRSHFRSMDIWHTASGSENYLPTGWLGRYLDSQCADCAKPHYALEVDDSLSLALKGNSRNGFAMSNIKQLQRATNQPFLKNLIEQTPAEHAQHNVAYLYKTLADTQQSAKYLYQKSKVHPSITPYPATEIGRDLQQIAELITADADTRIYYVSLGGFDTHVKQRKQQEKLLQQYAEAMAAFVKDLKHNQLLDETLIMTFSEFGRRVSENASGGTDHGTANNVFLMGGQLKKQGFYNAAASLSDLDNGDLKYDIDFRRIYATIIEGWLGAEAKPILGSSFQKMDWL